MAAEPDLSSASVALNTSVLYTGQAIGSALGGLLFALGYVHAVSFAGVAFVALGIGVWSITRDRAVAIKSQGDTRMARIRFDFGALALDAELLDTPTAKAIAAALPISSPVMTWGEEVYFDVPVNVKREPDARAVIVPGEIAYWPEDIDPGRAVMVGDTIWDVLAAERAGIRCVGLLCGGTAEAELRGAALRRCTTTQPRCSVTSTPARSGGSGRHERSG